MNSCCLLILVLIIVSAYLIYCKKNNIEPFFYFATPKPINDIVPPTDYTHWMGLRGPLWPTELNRDQAKEILNILKKKLPPGVKETDYFYGPLELRGGNNPEGIDVLRQNAIALYVQHQKYMSYYR